MTKVGNFWLALATSVHIGYALGWIINPGGVQSTILLASQVGIMYGITAALRENLGYWTARAAGLVGGSLVSGIVFLSSKTHSGQEGLALGVILLSTILFFETLTRGAVRSRRIIVNTTRRIYTWAWNGKTPDASADAE
jgi:hypothetical protein